MIVVAYACKKDQPAELFQTSPLMARIFSLDKQAKCVYNFIKIQKVADLLPRPSCASQQQCLTLPAIGIAVI